MTTTTRRSIPVIANPDRIIVQAATRYASARRVMQEIADDPRTTDAEFENAAEVADDAADDLVALIPATVANAHTR